MFNLFSIKYIFQIFLFVFTFNAFGDSISTDTSKWLTLQLPFQFTSNQVELLFYRDKQFNIIPDKNFKDYFMNREEQPFHLSYDLEDPLNYIYINNVIKKEIIDTLFFIQKVIKNYDLLLSNKIFSRGILFKKAKFNGILLMNNSDVQGKCSFSNCAMKIAGLRYSLLDSSLLIDDSHIYFLDSDNAIFNEKVSIKSSMFNTIDFSNSTFNGDLILEDVSAALLNLSSSAFKEKVTLKGILPEKIDLSSIKNIGYEIDLTTIQSPPKPYFYQINLLGANVDKIKLNYFIFRLYFPEQTSRDLKLSVYELLLTKFKKEGLMDSYELLDIEYKSTLKYTNNPFINFIQKIWWNYGYIMYPVCRTVLQRS